MKTISLNGLDVSRIGLGAMGMSAFYTGAGSDDAASTRTIHKALDLEVTPAKSPSSRAHRPGSVPPRLESWRAPATSLRSLLCSTAVAPCLSSTATFRGPLG